MSKITEERMREIIEMQLNANVENFELSGDGELVALDIMNFEDVLNGIIFHPEIKSLFECEEMSERYDHLSVSYFYATFNESTMSREFKCSACGYTLSNNKKCDGCSRKILGAINSTSIWPTEPPAPVAEYEVIEYEKGVIACTTKCPNKEGYTVPNVFCRTECRTNGLQNFAGHEVEGKSIRCMYRVNLGGDNG